MVASWLLGPPSQADRVRGTAPLVDIVGRTIVTFAPANLLAEAKRGEDGASAALEHLEMGLAEAQQCLSRADRPAQVRRVYAREMVVHQDGRSQRIVFPTKINNDVGAYLFEPGRKPCSVRTVNGAPSSLVMAIPSAAGEYFRAAGCVDADLHGFCAEGG